MDNSTSSVNNPPPFADNSQNTPGAQDRKKLIIFIGIAIFVLLVVAIAFFMFSGSSSRRSQTINRTENNNSQLPNTNTSVVSPSPTGGVMQTESGDAPGIIASNFYIWYVNHPSPIASGEYETRQDITEDFKKVMGRFYKAGINPGYDHVFCEDIVLPKTAVPEEITYDDAKTMALVDFKDIPGGREIFAVQLENVQGKWLVADVKCSLSE